MTCGWFVVYNYVGPKKHLHLVDTFKIVLLSRHDNVRSNKFKSMGNLNIIVDIYNFCTCPSGYLLLTY